MLDWLIDIEFDYLYDWACPDQSLDNYRTVYAVQLICPSVMPLRTLFTGINMALRILLVSLLWLMTSCAGESEARLMACALPTL